MFSKGQIVRGVKVGRFVVVKVEQTQHRDVDQRGHYVYSDGPLVATVREIGPQGQIARSTMRFPVSILVAE